MRVIFGWHLDGSTVPETADGAAFSMDTAVVGPKGLTDLIETKLGLYGPGVSPALRIAQYLARLHVVDDGKRFYSASLEADGWATARLLLGWRDSLVAGGWNPTARSWDGDRLSSLAEIELLEEPKLAPGLSDRLRVILTRLNLPSPIGSLEVIDQLDMLPPVWRALIEALRGVGTEVTCIDTSAQTGNNDLSLLQKRLRTGETSELNGDDSFVLVRADDEWRAAEIAAGWLLPDDTNTNEDLVIIRQGDSTVLNEACHRLGLPQPGGSKRSRWRSAMQVLPLAFETIWSPLNAGHLLELLVVPGSPIRPSINRIFAEALRESPGIGGPAWQKAWVAAKERYGRILDDGERAPADIEKAVNQEEAHWRAWLEPDRCDRAGGISREEADVVCRRVQLWALRRAAGTEDSVYRNAADAATALAEVISISGLKRFSKPQIDRMIDAVLADGIPLPDDMAESAPWTPVDRPGQVWGRVGTVLWWGFMDPRIVVADRPWSNSEHKELQEAGCQLESRDATLALEMAGLRRAFLNAGECVVCVIPSAVAGEPVSPHPLWHEIRAMAESGSRQVDGRSMLASPNLDVGGRRRAQMLVEHADFPAPQHTWQVPRDVIVARGRESATSIESLLGCPFRWVVRYQASIDEGALLDVADNNRLKGILAHAIITDLFAGEPLEDEDAVRTQAEALLDAYLPQIAAPFLLPGRTRDKEEVRRHTVDAALGLHKLMREARLSVDSAEQRFEGALDGDTGLIGFVDLLLRAANDLPVIVDLKWSNSDQYRRREIADGRPVQLATYSHLLKDLDSETQPPAGYFMLKQQRLLATSAAPFPDHTYVPGSDLGEVWNAVVGARGAALERLREGNVTVAGLEEEAGVGGATDDTDPPVIALDPPCRFCTYGRLCGREELR
jgi:ATP-dependent helicase/nuclease subunit B